MTKDHRCCGHPAKCAFDLAQSRCKVREQYEARQREQGTQHPQGDHIARFMSHFTVEERAAAEAAGNARKQRERARDRARGNDGERTLTR